ncbi:hypothetical protein BAJUN_01370 [Bajunvirus bajun]|uniref:Uncharacterized protein n=1 Tax=Brevundimonas phage vB_BgoS-Bajun TaxID=2948594 RepID=A0A9E7SUT8_9CAUD|nr:hypothetical protein BAJUN_01370 [Brevundimonas phage vB_BgoS-Bajun]
MTEDDDDDHVELSDSEYLFELAERSLGFVGAGHDDHARLHEISRRLAPPPAAKSFAPVNAWAKSEDPVAKMLRDALERLDRETPDVFGAKVFLHGLGLAIGLIFTHQVAVPAWEPVEEVEPMAKVWFVRPVVPGNPLRGPKQFDTYISRRPDGPGYALSTDDRDATLFTRAEVDLIKAAFPANWIWHFGDEHV